MNPFRPLRRARHLDRFTKALLATLAALALTACGNAAPPAEASSSLANGVQQILHSSEAGAAAARRDERIAQSQSTYY